MESIKGRAFCQKATTCRQTIKNIGGLKKVKALGVD